MALDVERLLITTIAYLQFCHRSEGGEGFYNIAHLCNNKYAVEWAVQVGANAVEMDLNFKPDGTPDKFAHSHFCDCTCHCPFGICKLIPQDNVCTQLRKTSFFPCVTQTDARELLNYTGYFGTTVVWRLDKDSSLREFSQYYGGIITNYPGHLRKVLNKKGIRMATPTDQIPSAISGSLVTDPEPYSCACKITWGGCYISKPSPRGLACRCGNHVFWCKGASVLCPNPNDAKCVNPDKSEEACKTAGGDCGGY